MISVKLLSGNSSHLEQLDLLIVSSMINTNYSFIDGQYNLQTVQTHLFINLHVTIL
jgi:hypothetical protein